MANGDLTPVDTVKLLSLFSGGKQTSTQKSDISAEGIGAMMQQILGSSQGLASVAQGQKSAGLYNSTVNTQLTNDLTTRLAGELAARQAGTTTTTRNSNPLQGNLGKALLAYSAYKKFGKTKLGSDLGRKGESWLDYMLGNTSVSPAALASANTSGDPLGALISSQGWSGGNSSIPTEGSSGPITGQALTASGEILSSSDTAKIIQQANQSDDSLGSMIEALGYSKKASDASSSASAASSVSGTSSVTAASEASYAAEADTAAGLIGNTSSATSSGGSTAGYIDSALRAYNASQTDKDYRGAIGSAILNAFGWGWATPIVEPVARSLSNRGISKGYDVNGIAGSFMAEPIGTIASGRYNEGDIFNAIMDPMDLFGGNEGGSVAGFVASPLVPFDAIFGTGIAADFENGLDKIGDFLGNIFGW